MRRRYNLERSDNFPYTGRMSYTCSGDGTIFVNTGFPVTSAIITWSSVPLYDYAHEFSSSSSDSSSSSSGDSSSSSSSSIGNSSSSSSSSWGNSSSSSSIRGSSSSSSRDSSSSTSGGESSSSSSMSSASSSSSSSSSQDSSSSSSIDSSSSSSLGVSGYVPLVPKMTSNSLPSPYVASASSNKSGFSAEYYAFDRTINAWFSSDSSTPQWIKIYMGSGNPKLAQHYSVTAAANAPTDWTLEGSNDDVSWDILDTRSNQTGWSGETRYYSNIENTTEYTYYRLNISAYSGGPFMVVREFQLYSYPGASYSSQSSSSSTSYRRWPGPFDLPRIYILSKQDTGFTVKYENIPEEVGYVEFAYMAM